MGCCFEKKNVAFNVALPKGKRGCKVFAVEQRIIINLLMRSVSHPFSLKWVSFLLGNRWWKMH